MEGSLTLHNDHHHLHDDHHDDHHHNQIDHHDDDHLEGEELMGEGLAREVSPCGQQTDCSPDFIMINNH